MNATSILSMPSPLQTDDMLLRQQRHHDALDASRRDDHPQHGVRQLACHVADFHRGAGMHLPVPGLLRPWPRGGVRDPHLRRRPLLLLRLRLHAGTRSPLMPRSPFPHLTFES